MDVRKFVIGQFLLFFLWPFGSFILSVATIYKYKSSRIIFILFAILYGYTFVFNQSEYGADNGRVIIEFESVTQMDHNLFMSYLEDDNATDLFLPVSFYIISRISKDPHVLYAFYAAIYSSFFILSFGLILRMVSNKKINYSIVLFSVLFLVYIRFSSINGVRFWIACFIYIYGVLKILLHSNYWYLLLVLLTPLIHFSYFFGVMIVLSFLLIGNKINYCYILLAVSVVFPVEILTKYLQSTGFFVSKVEAYFREDNVLIEKGKRADTNFYIEWGATIAQKFMTFALFVPRILLSDSSFDKEENRIYSFLVIFLSFLNFSSYSFEMYRRFFEIFIMICLFFFIKVNSNESIKFKSVKFIESFATLTTLALLPKVLLGFRSGFETLNVEIFYKSLFQISNFGTDSFYYFLNMNGII